MKGWAARWRADGWRRSLKHRAANSDLWGRLLDLCAGHEVEFIWVRGHSGDRENERCDRLAAAAARGSEWPDDVGYEPTPVAAGGTLFD